MARPEGFEPPTLRSEVRESTFLWLTHLYSLTPESLLDQRFLSLVSSHVSALVLAFPAYTAYNSPTMTIRA
jgi:hypothetical protein